MINYNFSDLEPKLEYSDDYKLREYYPAKLALILEMFKGECTFSFNKDNISFDNKTFIEFITKSVLKYKISEQKILIVLHPLEIRNFIKMCSSNRNFRDYTTLSSLVSFNDEDVARLIKDYGIVSISSTVLNNRFETKEKFKQIINYFDKIVYINYNTWFKDYKPVNSTEKNYFKEINKFFTHIMYMK